MSVPTHLSVLAPFHLALFCTGTVSCPFQHGCPCPHQTWRQAAFSVWHPITDYRCDPLPISCIAARIIRFPFAIQPLCVPQSQCGPATLAILARWVQYNAVKIEFLGISSSSGEIGDRDPIRSGTRLVNRAITLTKIW